MALSDMVVWSAPAPQGVNPIVLTSKNYLAGIVVGGALGALAMHYSMGMKKRSNPSKRRSRRSRRRHSRR